MKSYHCFVVATTIIETQKSENHSPRSVNGKLHGPIDEGCLQRLRALGLPVVARSAGGPTF